MQANAPLNCYIHKWNSILNHQIPIPRRYSQNTSPPVCLGRSPSSEAILCILVQGNFLCQNIPVRILFGRLKIVGTRRTALSNKEGKWKMFFSQIDLDECLKTNIRNRLVVTGNKKAAFLRQLFVANFLIYYRKIIFC